MVEDPRSWPIGLRRLADVIGPASAVKLAEVFGGTEDNYIPRKPKFDHPFVEVIGLDRTEELCEALGPGYYEIPKGTFRDNKKGRILDAIGTNRAVAQAAGVSERYVRFLRAGSGVSSQPGLFDKSSAED